MPAKLSDVRIRAVVPQDAEELIKIYRPYVLNTAITFEYDVPSAEDFRSRIENTLKRYPYLALVNAEGAIIGYAYASAFHSRAAYERCAEMSIYIKMEERGRGYGRMLYEHLEGLLAKQGVLNVNACIAVPRPESDRLDDSSVRFHTRMGYRMVGSFTQCGYKFGQWYDMCWMEKFIGEHTASPAPFVPYPELNKE